MAVVARTEVQWDARMPGSIHETVGDIRAAGGTATAIAADLANPDEVDTVIERARSALGPIGILVNNAALTIPGRPPTAPARRGLSGELGATICANAVRAPS